MCLSAQIATGDRATVRRTSTRRGREVVPRQTRARKKHKKRKGRTRTFAFGWMSGRRPLYRSSLPARVD